VVGRRYGLLGTGSLLVAIGCGLVLSWPPSSWSAVTQAAIGASGALLVVTIVAMGQARAMTRLRSRAAQAPADPIAAGAVRRGSILAGALRGIMALLTLSVVVLVAQALAR
jgi:hypothetical protein